MAKRPSVESAAHIHPVILEQLNGAEWSNVDLALGCFYPTTKVYFRHSLCESLCALRILHMKM